MRSVDWISVWKISRPLFILAFIATGLPIRMLIVRRLGLARPKLAWLCISIASAVFIVAGPLPVFVVLPAFLPVWLIAGERGVMSMLMAIPIAATVGIIEALFDSAMLRILLKEGMGKKRILVLFAGNATNVAITIGLVIGLLLMSPVDVIAALRFVE